MAAFNLLTDPFIPMQRADGSFCVGTILDVVDPENPPVAIVTRRGDTQLGLKEFLIGVFATFLPPTSDRAWLRYFKAPPAKDELADALAAAIPYFEAASEGVAFMQEFGGLEGKTVSAGALLIDGPGSISVENNTDVFTRRLRNQTYSRRAAAIALYVLQSCAPSGGKGYRTSVRGGGPLTTLIDLTSVGGRAPTLFQQIWVNVPKGEAADPSDYGSIFPWSLPTRTSTDGRQTTPEDVHPLQMFWGMPRRVRLHFESNVNEIPCDLTGEIDDVVCRKVVVKDYGTNYTNWRHPLTPYRRLDPKTMDLYRVAAPADRFGFRHWPGAAFETPNGSTIPAKCITDFVNERKPNLESDDVEVSIYAAGYAMETAKVLGFVEGIMPVLLVREPALRTAMGHLLSNLVEATTYAEAILGIALRKAIERQEAGDATPIEAAKRRMWADLENDFRSLYGRILADGEPDADGYAKQWLSSVRRVLEQIFDDVAPIDAFSALNPVPIVEARRLLSMCLSGYGESGRKLYKLLGLPVPAGSKKAAKEAA